MENTTNAMDRRAALIAAGFSAAEADKMLASLVAKATKANNVRISDFEEGIIKDVMQLSKSYADAALREEIEKLQTDRNAILADIKTAKEPHWSLQAKAAELEKAIADKTAAADALKKYSIVALDDNKIGEIITADLQAWQAKIAEKVAYFAPNAKKTGYSCNNTADAAGIIERNFRSLIVNLFLKINTDFDVTAKKPADVPADAPKAGA